MDVIIINEVFEKIPLTEESFLWLLQVASEHGWKPLGPTEIITNYPSLRDYLPTGRQEFKSIDTKDAVEIGVALRRARDSYISAQRDQMKDDDGEDAVAAQKEREDLMQKLVDFFQLGCVVVYKYDTRGTDTTTGKHR